MPAYRRLRMPRKCLKVLVTDLNRSESGPCARRFRAHHRSPDGRYGISAPSPASVRLNAGELDPLGPLLGFVGDQLSNYGISAPSPASVRLNAGELDHLGPLLGFVGDQLSKLSRRSRQRHAQVFVNDRA